METAQTQNEEETPKWLEELQLRSWEPEVLLSGIVLYGMFKTPELLDGLLNFTRLNVSSSNDFENVVAILKLGTYWLIFGLILHLISRGIWVGMVGLSYTFPQGINHQRIKFKERFRTKIEKLPPFQKIIINLEKICSSLFSMAFMLFMCVVGAYSYLFVLLVIPVFAIIYFDASLMNWGPLKVWVIAIVFVGLIGFVDFITLGYFKRFKWFAKIYWPMDVVISTLTLSRFYRPIYYAFVSNLNRWVIGCAFILFAVVSFFGLGALSGSGYAGDDFTKVSLWHNRTGSSAFSGYYEDQHDEKFSIHAQIPSDVIDGNVLKLFIPASYDKEKTIKEYVGYDSLRKLDSETDIEQFDLEMVKKFFQISIDDSVLTNVAWFYQYRMKTQQRGYILFIDISDLQEGVHVLSVAPPPTVSKRKWAEVPFYREVRDGSKNEKVVPAKEDEDYLQVKPLLPK